MVHYTKLIAGTDKRFGGDTIYVEVIERAVCGLAILSKQSYISQCVHKLITTPIITISDS